MSLLDTVLQSALNEEIASPTLLEPLPETRSEALPDALAEALPEEPQGPGFAALGLAPALLKALEVSGYKAPTAVQAAAIPEVLQGADLMVSSHTGSGKTAAFMLPALQKLSQPAAVKGVGPRVLVLTPTRELAQQVTKAAETYGRNVRLNTVSILGGLPYGVQIRLLKRPVDVLVATPGRLIDHMESGRIDFSRLEILVLDEADRMLDMGFIEDIDTIVAQTPAGRQTLLFSATLDGAVGKMAARMMRQPKRIEIASSKETHAQIEQRVHFADDMAHKERMLDHILRDTDLKQAIVFMATKRDAEQLAQGLNVRGFAAGALHGDMNQRQRTRTLQALHKGGLRVLVATDVAARGIDVAGISHVINFDLPQQPEDYVHRIGRTGRAGRSGIAVSFVTGKDFGQIKRIERYVSAPIPVQIIAGLEPRKTGFKRPSTGGGAAGRSSADRAPQRTHAAPGPRGFREGGRSQPPGRGGPAGRKTSSAR
jgi:superfamily II DNA/RNA helicase